MDNIMEDTCKQLDELHGLLNWFESIGIETNNNTNFSDSQTGSKNDAQTSANNEDDTKMKQLPDLITDLADLPMSEINENSVSNKTDSNSNSAEESDILFNSDGFNILDDVNLNQSLQADPALRDIADEIYAQQEAEGNGVISEETNDTNSTEQTDKNLNFEWVSRNSPVDVPQTQMLDSNTVMVQNQGSQSLPSITSPSVFNGNVVCNNGTANNQQGHQLHYVQQPNGDNNSVLAQIPQMQSPYFVPNVHRNPIHRSNVRMAAPNTVLQNNPHSQIRINRAVNSSFNYSPRGNMVRSNQRNQRVPGRRIRPPANQTGLYRIPPGYQMVPVAVVTYDNQILPYPRDIQGQQNQLGYPRPVLRNNRNNTQVSGTPNHNNYASTTLPAGHQLQSLSAPGTPVNYNVVPIPRNYDNISNLINESQVQYGNNNFSSSHNLDNFNPSTSLPLSEVFTSPNDNFNHPPASIIGTPEQRNWNPSPNITNSSDFLNKTIETEPASLFLSDNFNLTPTINSNAGNIINEENQAQPLVEFGIPEQHNWNPSPILNISSDSINKIIETESLNAVEAPLQDHSNAVPQGITDYMNKFNEKLQKQLLIDNSVPPQVVNHEIEKKPIEEETALTCDVQVSPKTKTDDITVTSEEVANQPAALVGSPEDNVTPSTSSDANGNNKNQPKRPRKQNLKVLPTPENSDTDAGPSITKSLRVENSEKGEGSSLNEPPNEPPIESAPKKKKLENKPKKTTNSKKKTTAKPVTKRKAKSKNSAVTAVSNEGAQDGIVTLNSNPIDQDDTDMTQELEQDQLMVSSPQLPGSDNLIDQSLNTAKLEVHSSYLLPDGNLQSLNRNFIMTYQQEYLNFLKCKFGIIPTKNY